MWNLTKTFLAPEDSNVIIKVDPVWGFSEFPQPGDTKKHSLPVLIDYELLTTDIPNSEADYYKNKSSDATQTQFWMPDRYCKVCYGCEEAFTMYRRRHHCRMCGQIFCNNCSSFYIDGMMFNTPGLVRACRLCYDQQFERTESENRLARRKLLDKAESSADSQLMAAANRNQSLLAHNANKSHEVQIDLHNVGVNLQNRASAHFNAIVERLVSNSAITKNRELWREAIQSLVREVVSSVDPDVRGGDGLDIRQYVKIKIIPGGSMDESTFVDGVVFRKNVSHKKMAKSGTKTNPRILLLAGGIEFQRTDAKLSSMDTLIEQEDKYMEILVEKIMSLKPDIILVGKAVARKAQELLCEHKVVVMQNVKPQLLERIGRMTGAMLLPSTDHMIKQFGEECLGTCGEFRLRVVQDDPEKVDSSHAAPRILRTRISRGSTYAYVTGCPSERGCTILLRGDTRDVLSDVKRIIEFAMVTAYHLRLEVSYYKDRYADLPPPESAEDWEEDGSDADDVIIDVARDELIAAAAAIASGAEPVKKKIRYGDVRARRERYYYSSSLDVDISLPYSKELVGTQLFHHHSKPHNVTLSSAEQHQTLLITSLLMSETNGTPTQKASAEVKGIKYYTKQDIALGQFIVDNCFQLGRFANRGESRMLEQTLSFIHRPGRIDISVHRNETHVNADGDTTSQRDPFRIPIFMTSFCKECKKNVTPLTMMSDETWKMSFGKFLEMFFYNRTAVCKVGGCSHQIRDNHTLSFQCEGYVAVFDFIPQHAFALHVREGMEFPDDFHNQHTAVILKNLPTKHMTLMEDFKMAVVVLEREIREMLSNRPDDLALAMADITLMEAEISAFSQKFAEELLLTYTHLPKKFQEVDIESMLRSQLVEKICNVSYRSSGRLQPLVETIHDAEEAARLTEIPDEAASAVETQPVEVVSVVPAAEGGEVSVAGSPDERISVATAVGAPPPIPSFAPDSPQNKLRLMSSASAVTTTAAPAAPIPFAANYNVEVALRFPMHHMRETFIKTSVWNHRIDTIYKFLEAVRHLVIHQQQLQSQNPGSTVASDIATFEEEYWEARRPLENMHVQYSRKPGGVPTTAHLQAGPSVPFLDPMTPLSPMDDLNNFPTHLPPPPPFPVRDASDSLHQQSMHPLTSVDSIAPSVMLGPSISVATTTPASVAAATAPKVAFAEQPKKASDKGVDKVSRFTKLVKNLVLGNKDTSENEHGKFLVPIGDFGEGRYGLPPGRRGEVIPVHEDEYATIIAYSLASSEYYDDLQLSIREDGNYDTSSAADYEEGGAEKASFAQASGKPMSASAAASSKKAAPAAPKSKTQMQHEDDNEDADDDNNYGGSNKTVGNNGNETSELERAFAKAENSTAMLGTSANLFSAGGDVIFKDENDPEGGGGAGGGGGRGTNGGDGLSDEETEAAAAAAEASTASAPRPAVKKSVNEKQMISQNKSYIRHRFNDLDEDGNVACKFQCQIYWAKQFEAVRSCYFNEDNNENFIRSLSMSSRWSAQGGKSGAAFSKSMDDRLVIKVISRVELQMFLEFAPAYFEYMAKNYYHSLPTVLCKILGVYTVRFHNKESGKKVVENVVVMENIFYQRNITRTFDLKGSSRARYVELAGQKLDDFDEALLKRRKARKNKNGESSKSVETQKVSQVLLDDNLMELTRGRPFPLKHRAKLFFHKAVLNDTLFLSIVNVVDYSILVGFDETNHELVVGIIDYLRQYDIIKKMERMGKSVGMLTGQAAPTIIQPSQYRKRFSLAMERYFMTVPDKWVSHDA